MTPLERLRIAMLNRLKRLISRFVISKISWISPVREQVEQLASWDPEYFSWLIKNKLNDDLESLLRPVPADLFDVRFSVVMPAYNTDPDILEKAVRSVTRQRYPNWELIICDDASDRTETIRTLSLLNSGDSRIRVITNDQNSGISTSTNRCVENATGEYILFLDHDDEVYPDALSKFREAVLKNSGHSIFYSDEDYISPSGLRHGYNFKPGFSPTLLETHNYVLHPVCISKDLFERAGGLRRSFDGSQDYDLLLRLMDMGEDFVHIPHILYSWRESDTSMIGGSLKPAIFNAGKRALEEHFQRRGVDIEEIRDNTEDIGGVYRTRLRMPDKLEILIIQTGNNSRTKIPDLSMEAELFHWENRPLPLELIDENKVVIFLDGSTTPFSWPEFIKEMAPLVLRDDVGAAGGLVLSEDNRIICAGKSLMPWGEVSNEFFGVDINKSGLNIRQRDMFAVSRMAMAISGKLLRKILESGELDSDLWDIEICIRAASLNRRVVFTPHASAFTKDPDRENLKFVPARGLLEKYSINGSPLINPNLVLKNNGMEYDLPDQLPSPPRRDHEIEADDYYNKWLKFHAPDISESEQRIKGMEIKPFFSIILPTYNSELKFFKKLLSNLESQTYGNFEICISDDASDDSPFRDYLERKATSSGKIRVSFLKKNRGIAGNTNNAIAMAEGDYLVFCDHDDLMEVFALEFIALYINENPDAGVIYSDEDMVDQSGVRHTPRLHPDWNPDMFLSHMYCPHIVCFKKEVARRAGKLKAGMDGAQDYDFVLRATENTDHIGHIPMVLYSWRSVQGSVALDASAKTYAYDAGRKALEEAMERRGEDACVVKAAGTHMGIYRVKRSVADTSLTHIIEAGSGHISSIVKSIRDMSRHPVEVVIMCREADRESLIVSEHPDVIIRYVPDSAGRAQIYNEGAEAATGNTLIFSSKEMDILDSDYPDAILEHTHRQGIGAVGIKMIYPNGLYYHTGMILGVNGVAGYAHRNMPQHTGYWNFPNCIRNYSAVSWDFMGISRDVFFEVNGFDTGLNSFGDVDLCLKLIGKGYRNLYTPYVSAVLNRPVHFLNELRNSREEEIIMARHGDYIKNDPMHHPLLSKDLEDFSI